MPHNRKPIFALALFHIAVIALANYAVQFTASVAGIAFTWGMFVFPLVILATDLTVRLSGPTRARIIVAAAYIPAILISAHLADWRIGLASGSAYLLGQLLDIAVFQRIRARSRRWWTAPLISTFFANILDTYIFYAAAFYRSADSYMADNWMQLAAVDAGFKVVVSVLVFLPMYGMLLRVLLTRLTSLEKGESRRI